jgi:prepilin-type N-terminal cleavage/methylation domain-containing protein/prepilin-type processing-associated H-X9-DG protein
LNTAIRNKSIARVGSKRVGFTLVELLVVMSIIGILSGVLLPAIQNAREAARRATCQNNLRNHVAAIQKYELDFGVLPPGRDQRHNNDWAWSFYILPMLEQASLYQAADRKSAWDAPVNAPIVDSVLPIFRCPSSVMEFAGDCDYAGLTGTIRNAPQGYSPFNRGLMVYVDDTIHRPLLMASVFDGISQTLCVSESHDLASPIGRWASGLNCLSHDRGSINSSREGIRSQHAGGANAAFLDGAVAFFINDLDEEVLASLLTRNGGEIVQELQ